MSRDRRLAAIAGGLYLITFASSIPALALLPIVRRTHPINGYGFVAARVLEAAVIFTGVVALGTLLDLRAAASDPVAFEPAARALVAVNEWAFLIGPGLIPALNAALLATALLGAGLVPRAIPTIGLIGAPLLLASAVGAVFDLHEQTSATAALLALPIAAWEFSLGVWLLARGTQQSG